MIYLQLIVNIYNIYVSVFYTRKWRKNNLVAFCCGRGEKITSLFSCGRGEKITSLFSYDRGEKITSLFSCDPGEKITSLFSCDRGEKITSLFLVVSRLSSMSVVPWVGP